MATGLERLRSAGFLRSGARATAWTGLLLSVFLLLYFGFDLGGRSFSSPDEGRYIDIPMEMLASGDFILPRIDGVLYFEKPPLFYWLNAASIWALGLSEWSGRLATALAGLFGCWLTFACGQRLYGRKAGLAAALILATSLLYYILARLVIIDMLVSVLIAATLFLFILGAQVKERRPQLRYFRTLYVAAALSVLSKGLIGIVLPGMVIVLWIALTGRWRVLLQILIPSGILLFLAITLPWHVLAAQQNDEFLWYYFVHEHFLRFMTQTHHRVGPMWYFVPVVLAGFLPWTGFLWTGLRAVFPTSWRLRAHDPVGLFLLLWSAVIFAFFSMSGSKLVPYILPIFPALALLTGRAVAAQVTGGTVSSRAGMGIAAGSFALLALAAPVAWQFGGAFGLRDFPDYRDLVAPIALPVAACFALGAGCIIYAWRRQAGRAAVVAVFLTAVLGWSGVSLIASRIDPNSVKPLALAIKSRLGPGDLIVSYAKFYYDLPVYLERRVAIAGNVGELAFGAAQEDVSDILLDTDRFWTLWRGERRVFAVMRASEYENLLAGGTSPMFLIGRTRSGVAVSNRPADPRPRR